MVVKDELKLEQMKTRIPRMTWSLFSLANAMPRKHKPRNYKALACKYIKNENFRTGNNDI